MKAYKTEHSVVLENCKTKNIIVYDMKAAAMSMTKFFITSRFDYGNIFSGASGVHISEGASENADLYGVRPE